MRGLAKVESDLRQVLSADKPSVVNVTGRSAIWIDSWYCWCGSGFVMRISGVEGSREKGGGEGVTTSVSPSQQCAGWRQVCGISEIRVYPLRVSFFSGCISEYLSSLSVSQSTYPLWMYLRVSILSGCISEYLSSLCISQSTYPLCVYLRVPILFGCISG